VSIVRFELGEFAREGIEARLGAGVEAGARAAMLRYADRLESPDAPLPLPRFLEDRFCSGVGSPLELELDAKVQAALEREAERQEVALRRIASHAVLTYLAELDAVGAVSSSTASGTRR
jgi:hypothetical protein